MFDTKVKTDSCYTSPRDCKYLYKYISVVEINGLNKLNKLHLLFVLYFSCPLGCTLIVNIVTYKRLLSTPGPIHKA